MKIKKEKKRKTLHKSAHHPNSFVCCGCCFFFQMKNKQMVNLHLSSALPSKLKRGNHETSIWWDKLGHAQRPAKPGCGFQMEPRGKPTDTHRSFTTPVNSYSKVIVVWLMRGFPYERSFFSVEGRRSSFRSLKVTYPFKESSCHQTASEIIRTSA